MEKIKEQKVHWCKCTSNLDLVGEIEKGSIPKDTGRVCAECGGKIMEDIRRSGWKKESLPRRDWHKIPRPKSDN